MPNWSSSLSDEDLVSVAEQVMERSGLSGNVIHVPHANVAKAQAAGRYDQYGDPDVRGMQRENSAEAEKFVNGILRDQGWDGNPNIQVKPNHWDLRERGSGQALTDGMNYIGLSGEHVNPMTLLHETAHILTKTPHKPGGHGPKFQRVVHDLYQKHLGQEAADTFAGIIWPDEARTTTAARRWKEGSQFFFAVGNDNSLLVGPADAYDETDWFMRHYQNPPNEDVTDKTWYHVSPHMIPVGTVLQPMHGETPWGNDPYDHGLQNRANWVWVEHDKDKAKAWMHWVLQKNPDCYLYVVHPHLGPYAWNGTADEGWVTDRAEVSDFLDRIGQDLQFQES